MLQVFCIAREYKFFCNNTCCGDANVWRSQIWKFFLEQHPPTEFANATPPKKIPNLFLLPTTPPPHPISPRNFAGKTWISLCQGLQVVEYSSNQTLDYIGVTKKKVSFFCLQRATCMTQENEARNRNTSIRSQMISEFILEYTEFKSYFFVGNWSKLPFIREFWSAVRESGRLALYPGELAYMRLCCFMWVKLPHVFCKERHLLFYPRILLYVHNSYKLTQNHLLASLRSF